MVLFPLNVSGFPWIYLGYNLEINFLSDSKKIKVSTLVWPQAVLILGFASEPGRHILSDRDGQW